MEMIWALQKGKAKFVQEKKKGNKEYLSWVIRLNGTAIQITRVEKIENQVTGVFSRKINTWKYIHANPTWAHWKPGEGRLLSRTCSTSIRCITAAAACARSSSPTSPARQGQFLSVGCTGSLSSARPRHTQPLASWLISCRENKHTKQTPQQKHEAKSQNRGSLVPILWQDSFMAWQHASSNWSFLQGWEIHNHTLVHGLIGLSSWCDLTLVGAYQSDCPLPAPARTLHLWDHCLSEKFCCNWLLCAWRVSSLQAGRQMFLHRLQL